MSRRTVAICGSCATRDNFNSRFNPDHHRWYEVVAANHQSSVLALMSPPIEPEFVESDGLDSYAEQTLRGDLTRAFLGDLVRAQPEYLVIDFSGDVWFGALRLPDGRFLTDNVWKLRQTAYYQRLMAAGGVKALSWRVDPEEYFTLWTESMDRFAAYLAEHCPDTTVIVHRIRSTGTVVLDQHDRPQSVRDFSSLDPLDLRAINGFRARLDDHAVSAYGWDSIDLRRENYTAHADHPWGAFWVHYTFDYHRRFLAEMHRRDLTSRVDPATAARIEAIAAAGSERLVGQARFVRQADQAQLARIRELESSDVRSAGRSALGRLRSTRKGAGR